MSISRLLVFVAFLTFANSAMALRCGNKLVTEGDPIAKVLKFCGEPASVQVRSIYRAGFPRQLYRNTLSTDRTASEKELLFNDRSYVEVLVEEWTYNFGPRRLMRTIYFENGLVAQIKRLGYGYSD